MIWGAHWCLIFYLFSASVRASLLSKPQTENLVSEISVAEQGISEKYFCFVSAASEAKPKPFGAHGLSRAHSPSGD